MNFKDIKKFPICKYRCDVPWWDLENWITRQENLNMDPDFQRGYVWTDKQKTQFLEYSLRGGISARQIYFNHPGWLRDWKGDFVIIDGKQRVSAVLDFVHDKVKAFGQLFSEFGDTFDPFNPMFSVNIADFKTKKEILEWYLAFNTGGTVHSDEEIEKVKKLIEEERNKND